MLIAEITNSKSILKSVNWQLMTGIFWKILSCACFAGINVTVRYLSGAGIALEQKLSCWMIMFFQNLVGTIFLLPFVLGNPGSFKKNLSSNNVSLQIIRMIVIIVSLLFWYTSLSKMPVTQVVVISFISPVITVLGASCLLKERLTFNKVFAVCLSLIGGFLISRPDQTILHNDLGFDLVLPIIAALLFSVDKLITRKILILEGCPKLTTMYMLLFTCPLCLIGALVTDTWVWPAPSNFFPLLLLGLLSVLANFAFTKSLASAELTAIMPYGISKVIFSSLFSYWVFKEIPQTLGIWLGVIVISISTVLLV